MPLPSNLLVARTNLNHLETSARHSIKSSSGRFAIDLVPDA